MGIIYQDRKSGYYLRSYPPAWQAPYAIILPVIFSPLQREPHGPNITNLAIVLSLSVLICRMNQLYSGFLERRSDK